MGVGIGWRDEGCTSRGVRKNATRSGGVFGAGDGESGAAPPVADAASRFQGSAFGGRECGRQTAGTTGQAAQRRQWRMQQAAFKAAPRLADANVAARRLAQRGKRRSAAGGGCSKPLSRQRPVWRTRECGRQTAGATRASGAAPPVADAASRFQGNARLADTNVAARRLEWATTKSPKALPAADKAR